VAFAAIGLRNLSMRPASIGPVKELLRKIDLGGARAVIDAARSSGAETVRPALTDWLSKQGV
jgi:phosphotransferase system, enzyme I, PtsP